MFQSVIKKHLLLISVFLINSVSFSQTKYSNDPAYILSKPEGEHLITSDFTGAYPDTSVNNLNNYRPRNFSGNLGLAQPNYMLTYKSSPLGFKLYELPYSPDIITPQQVSYYKTKGPFASLSGFAGSKQEQMFRMLFSHTTKKNLNITVNFNRYGSVGYYLKQQSFVNNFYSSLNYSNRSKRFGFYGYVLYNKVKHQENGGIKYDTIIDRQPLIGKDLLSVNLSNAKRENRNTNVSFNPWFKLNKGDSSTISHYIDYKFNYSGSYYWYVDKGIPYETYYKNIYLDSTITIDSTHLKEFKNQLNYTFRLNKLGLGAKVGYAYETSKFKQRVDSTVYFDSLFTNQLIKGSLFFNKLFINKDSTAFNRNKKITSELNYNTVFSGQNINDSKLELKTQVKFRLDEHGFNTKHSSAVFLNVLSEQRHPDFIYNMNRSNNFRWSNKFKSVNLFQLNAGFVHYKSGLSVNILWQNFGNYLYMDSTALPKQSNVVISNWAYNLNYQKVFFRHLGLRLNLTYQTTNKSVIMRIAPMQAIGNLYYTGNLFKNNLQLQIGAQCEYYQTFKSYAYMPAYNMYYLQNSFKVGNYPFVDVYLNARIKPVQFFLKLENALYGLTGTNYSFVKGYMQPDRAFRFGLTWLFFD